jgi:hypothetical protein
MIERPVLQHHHHERLDVGQQRPGLCVPHRGRCSFGRWRLADPRTQAAGTGHETSAQTDADLTEGLAAINHAGCLDCSVRLNGIGGKTHQGDR